NRAENQRSAQDRGRAQNQEPAEFPALGGKELQEIFLPSRLEGIGDYAFYGCLNLKRLHLPASLKRLGGGVFVACNHIRQLFFMVGAESETPFCMKDVLAELSYEVEVILEDRRGKIAARLVYPEYYEESKENTPARIIEIIFHGTGYKYRQCFQGRCMDYHQYDALFYLASVQEFPPTVIRMAVDRLETPAELSPAARDQYLAWLRKEYRTAAGWLFEQNRPELLRMLGDYGYYSEEILNYFLEAASRQGDAVTVSYLMDYRRSHFGAPRKKKYVL
ncbi:MAG: leucine-rich repeat protein, partial [Lachnospiraceae bacterium]|nr:leucine-rich repeat protein [Lachnospiraceae bacterium]